MAPVATNPGNQIHNTNPNLPYYDGMNLAADILHYADSSTSDIDSSPDIGTHSNFVNQQVGPDSTYDTLNETNAAPAPTNSEDDIDSDSSDVDSTPDQGIEGTFANAQGTTLDSNYFVLQEESIISDYGGETGSVFVTGALPDMADRDKLCLYQAIFWNPTDDVYEISRVEFNYTGSQWLKSISQGSGLSSPTTEWSNNNKQVAFWAGSSSITVQPHTAYSFFVTGKSNKINSAFYVDIRITANSSTYTEVYHTSQFNGNRPAAQLWLGSSLPPTQIHTVAPEVQTTVYMSIEEASDKEDILSGGTLTIDVPVGFTGLIDVGGTSWGTATINGNQITVSNTAAIRASDLTYAFTITSPSTPGLYKLDVAFDDGLYAHPIGNFTIHVTGVPPTVEKVNVEYQWSSATFDDSFEEVCINVGTPFASENLEVNYWDGFTWNVLGIISSTGWTNLTATGLTASTYTIQLIGTSESIDSTKDTWNIDLITLHTWSVETFNYKLDLEVQWTSADFTQTDEELCIYTGSLDTEGIRGDIWNISTLVWDPIFFDLTANSWNNFSIASWLTSSTFTIRFRGDFETGDTNQSSWEIDVSLLHTWSNSIPQNTAAPTIALIDDTSFLYAEYRQYEITANVSDADGFSEIDYLELTLTSDDRGTEYWTVRYDEDTNLFTEQSDPSNYITLNTSSSSATESGNDISATFFITINWDHPNVVNTDMKSEVFDANPSSAFDYYEVDWDVETRLDMSTGPILTDGSGTINRGDPDSSLTASGTVTYLGSTLIPSASDIDIWISSPEYGTQAGPWQATNYEDVGGTFSAIVYADDLVGLDTYTFKAVSEGTGAGGADYFNVSQTDDYIADRVQVQSYSTVDSRINVNSSASLHAVLYYDYDNSFVTDGTVTINGITAIYSGSNGVWDFTDEQSTGQLVTYDTLVYSGGAHGITVEDQNGQSIDQIWDYVKVVSYSAIDARVDVDSNAIIDVTLVYEYDSSFVVDGTITVNGASATHQGSGVWRITVSNGSVVSITYNLVVASGNTNGISLVDQNSQSQLIIWDRVIVTLYSIADNRVTIDDTVNLDVTLEYEYDSAPVDDGTVTINLVSASHTGGGVWRISVSKSTVQGVTYNTVACSGNGFGISEVNQNSQAQLIIWDQITVRSYTVLDGRVNLDDSVNVDVLVQYEYDDTNVTDGTVTINTISATNQVGGIWRIVESKATVQSFTYDTVACSGNTLGITSVNQNSQSTTVIWDQITVRSYTVLDGHVNVDDSVNIDALLEYEYDDTPVIDGSVTINTISATHQGGGVWRIVETKASVQSFIYDAIVCSGNSNGITDVNQNSQTTEVIWDQVVVRSYTILDGRITINTAVAINFTLEYEYDNSPVTDGTVTLNGISATHIALGVWQITQSKSSVQSVTYNNVQSSGNLYGIDNVNQNSQSQEIIWDQITVRSYSISNNRVNISTSVNIGVTLEYEYGDSIVTDGSVTINGFVASYQGAGLWRITQSQGSVQEVVYDTVVCSGNTLGISSVNQNGQSGAVIWDQVTVRSYTVLDNRVNIDDPVNIDVLIEYEYDDTAVEDGTVTINGISAAYQGGGVWRIVESKATVQSFTYDTVACSGNTHGITVENQNGQSTEVIWDQITVRSYTVLNGRVNIDDSVNIDVLVQYEYDDAAVTDGSVTINTISATHQGSGVWRIVESKATVQSFTYDTVACSGNTHGITSVNQNAQSTEVIWDQITVRSYTVLDGRVNIDDSVNIDVLVQYEYDDTNVTDGSVTINTISASHVGSGIWRIVESKATVQSFTYDTVACSGNTLGITSVNQNAQSTEVIWDQITVRSYTVLDGRVNIDDSVNISVLLEYEYDDSIVTDGSVTINTISASYVGSGIWRIVESKATVQSFTYDTVACSGNTLGITSANQNAQSTEVIWDQITVRSYAVLDARVDISTVVAINFTLEYEYDDSPVTDGIVTLNGTSATHQSGGVWQITQSRASVQALTYIIVLSSGNLHGIDHMDLNSQSQEIIWDQITVRQYNVIDDRVNLDDSVNIDVTLEYEYDDSPVTDGSVTINGNSATHQGVGVWRISQSRSSVQGVTYDTVACSANTHGISTVNQDSQSQLVIWDQITVRGYEVSDARDNVGDTIIVTVELEYEYDDSDVTGGTVTINSVSFTYTGLGKWSASRMQSSVTDETYDTVSASGNAHGITDINQNGQSQVIIWDRIQVLTTTVDDGRLDTDTSCEIRVTLMLEYDSTLLGLGDSVTLNGVAMTWDGADSRFELSRQQSSVGQWTYFVNSSLEATYDISALNLDSNEISVIWDQIKILATVVDDGRVNVDSAVELRVTAVLAFDDHPLASGDSFVMDSAAMNWDAVNTWFDLSRTKSTVGLWNFQVGSASETTYGITVVDLNGQSQDVIWDRLVINIVADLDSVENGIQVNFTMTVTFEYDSVACITYNLKIDRNVTHWLSFTDVNVSSFIDTNSDVTYLYNATVVVSETNFGITVFSTNLETVEWGAGTVAPVNAATPVLTNPDNTDFMYSRLKFYIITSNASDAQGYLDITYIELSLWDNSRSTEIWRIRFTESTNVFSIEVGSDYITLSGSSYSKSGFDIDITWSIKIDWDHQDLSNIDVRQYVIDSGLESDDNWYEVDWDVETRLDYSITPSLSDDRGDLNTNDLVCSGTVVYYGSALYPLANETDVWVLHDVSGTWTTNVDGSGAFTVSSITSSSSVRLNNYTIKVVVNGDGSGGTDLYYTSSETTEFITDRIEFYLSGAEDGRINVNDTGVVWWNARYEYDSTEIIAGLTAYLNGSKVLSWDGVNTRWYYQESSQSVIRIGYTLASANESGYGLTGWVKSASDVSIIWDLVVVRSYSVTDARTNVSDTVDIDVLLEYEFDDSYVDDGTVQINSILATYQGSGIWRISESQSSVQSITYDTVTCLDNTFKITNVNQNFQSQEIIWDRIIVTLYDVTDAHVNVDDSVNIDVTLSYEFDSVPLTDGSVSINGVSASHLGLGVWRIVQTRASVQSVTYNSVACSGNTNDIAVVNQNSLSQEIIWDQVVVQSYTILDYRVNVDDSVNIDFVLHYGYDDSAVTDGSVSINAISASHQGAGVWRIIDSKSSVQAVTYDTVSCSGNTHGITNVDQNSLSEEVIWDQITVRSYSVLDSRINLDSLIDINVTLEYEYDDSDVVNGVVLIQSVSATHVGNGIWRISMVKSSVQSVTFNSVVCSGNALGISSVNQNGQQLIVIWDQIMVRSYIVTDSRVNVDDSVNIDVLIEYEYDDSPVTDGTVTINGATANHIAAGVWRVTDTKSSVQSVTYDLVACFVNLHGISDVNQNSQSHTVIWDQVVVQSYSALDVHVNIDDNVSIDVVLRYGYDDSPVTVGSVSINSIDAIHQGSGVWRFSDVKSSVQAFTYDTVVCSGNTHGIINVDQNSQSEEVIWDQIVVRSYVIVNSRVEIDVLVTINVTLEYDYGGTDVIDGAVLIQSVSATHVENGIWQITMVKSSVQNVTFNSVICSGNFLDISAVNQNGQQLDVIWDEIIVHSYTVTDSRVNVDDFVNIDVLIQYGFDNANVTDGNVTINGVSAAYVGAGVWRITTSNDSVQAVTYNLVACFGNLLGIGVVDQNSQTHTVIWDRIQVLTTTVSDGRIDTDTSCEIRVTLMLEYDSTPLGVGDTVTLNGVAMVWDGTDSRFELSRQQSLVGEWTYFVNSSIEATYGISALNLDSNEISVIWDQIIVQTYTIVDSRVEIDILVTINVSLEYEFDATDVVNGVVLIQSVSASYVGNGVWQITMVKSSVQSVTFDSVICSGNALGISAVNQNGQQEIIIWDKITVRSFTANDSRVNVGDDVNITVLVEYEYDDTPVTVGTVTINGASALHIGAGIWQITDSNDSVLAVTYNLVACSGNTEGITVVDQNGLSTTIIWDRIQVLTTTVDDGRLDIDTSCELRVTLVLEYDSTPLGLGDTVTLNGVAMVWDAADSRFELARQQSSVGQWTYFVNSSLEATYGISDLNLNSNEISVIWDQIVVQSLIASDYRDDIGATITVNITLQFEYDDSIVSGGSVIVNSISFTYSSADGIWSTNRLRNSVTDETFNTTVVSGNSFDITVVNQSGLSITIIWDRIQVLTTLVDDPRINTGTSCEIRVILMLEYDSTPLGDGDIVTLDGVPMAWDIADSRFELSRQQSSVGQWTYFVNSSLETLFGISALNLDSQEISVIWDALSITVTPDATDVNDYDTVTFTLAVTFSYDSSSCTSYIVDISRNGTYWLSFTTSNVSQFVDDNIDRMYNYSTFAVAGESTFGITVFTTNTVNVTWSTPTNFDPNNNGAPKLLNPDDSDNMYSRLRFYFIVSSFVDHDGSGDIDYVELSLWDNSRLFEVWRVRFTTATESFSIVVGSEYIDLSSSSSNLSLGSLLNVTWCIKIDWDHFDLQNIDMQQYVIDSEAASDDDWFESDWDVETRLDYSLAPSLSDNWGDVDTNDLLAFGTVIYYGSSDIYPLANETDIWVIHDFTGSWSGDVNSFGVFSVSGIGSSSLVRLNTYTFKIVEAGGSVDLYYTTSLTDSFITDRIEFYESGVADSRININSPCDVWLRVRYNYSHSEVQSGLTAYLNGIHLLTWDSANSRWHFQEVRSSSVNRSYTISSALETTLGISSWVQTAADRSVVWDSLIISITDPFDQRTNVNTNATGIRVSAIYSYDSTPFDGTILLSNNTFQFSTVHRQYYTATSAFGDSYGITVIVVNDQTWCIWDQIEVVSIITNMTYLDPSEYVRVQIELRFDFDDAPVTSGNFSLKFEELVHLADGIWEVNVTRLTYSTVNFDTLTICEATAFGITSFDMYGNEQVVYWDRLEFFVAYTTDSRIDVGSTGFIIWAIKLQTAGINITSGVIAEVSDGSILTFVSDNWRSAHSSDLVEDITFTMVSASLEGIDFFVRSTSDVTIIWDRIKVVSTSATITNPEIERYIQIQATLVFEYDNSPVTSGVVTLWDQDSQMSMIYNATGGFWFANLTKVETGNYTFYISAVSGNLYGITVVELAGNLIIVEYVPTILPRLTMEMIITISSGFGIILLASAILIRKKYLVKVPYEIKQINRALKSMEKGEPVELLDVRSLDNLLLAVLEPGLVELGLSPVEIFGEETSDGEIEESWAPDSEAELLDIMDEFKIPDYKQELDEGELDVSILSESESEAAWAKMLEEVRRIESEEGRKIPLTKEDWIERIPSEIKSIFFEEELRELDISELEHLTQLTPTEVQEIVDSISANEEMYTLEPEASASVISSALCEKFDSKSGEELDETEMKERLIQFLPTFVREFFSTTWLDKLSCAEIQELVTIPEEDLKIVIQSLMDSRDAAAEAEKELEVVTEAESEMEVEPELEIQTEAEPEVVVDESAVEHDDPRMTELVEKYGEEKANFLFTIPEALLEGIPEEQIKEMDMDTLVGLKQALEPEIIEDEVSEDTTEIEEISEPEAELKDDLMTELKIEPEAEPKDPEAELKADLLAELKSELKPEPEDTEAELEIEAEDEPESDPEDEPKE